MIIVSVYYPKTALTSNMVTVFSELIDEITEKDQEVLDFGRISYSNIRYISISLGETVKKSEINEILEVSKRIMKVRSSYREIAFWCTNCCCPVNENCNHVI